METTGTATYSPEDNKLRFYPFHRLEAELYERVKAQGFKWAPKQELFVAPMWTPARADLLVELCEEIEDEDKSLAERAEERADRMETYADNRAQDAEQARQAVSAIADNIPMGQPILVGHHSERHARRDAEKIENGMRRSIKMWEQSQYWKDRAKGAIRHAKYKERPDVRARRIKTLEADKRKQEKGKAEIEIWLRLWTRVLDDEKPIITKKDGTPTTALERARWIADRCWLHIDQRWTAFDVLRPDGERYKDCPSMAVEEVQAVALRVYPQTIAHYDRWITHLENRLTYERAMLEADGGTVTDKKGPEVGGAVKCWASPRNGWAYIQKVNKVTITIWDNWGNGGADFTRTIKLTDIKKIMTAQEVQDARDTGYLIEITTKPSRGFVLRDDPAPVRQVYEEKPANAFDQMKETLREGVKVVVADQLFPTPPDLARRMVEIAEIEPEHTVLEPSAGTGNIAKAIREAEPNAHLDCIEINSNLCQLLKGQGFDVLQHDFLDASLPFCPDSEKGHDRILMNPPFTHGEDIKHIEHAMTFLKPGGRLVAICANGPRQNETLKPLASHWEELPVGTFAEQGTNVNVALMVYDAD